MLVCKSDATRPPQETITMLHKEHEGLCVGVAETILTQKNQEQIIKTCM